MDDFSPEARAEFVVPTDGEFHTIKLKVRAKKNAESAASIVRLRLDPADMPGQVRLESIRIVCR
jgi:hypothetical protein